MICTNVVCVAVQIPLSKSHVVDSDGEADGSGQYTNQEKVHS